MSDYRCELPIDHHDYGPWDLPPTVKELSRACAIYYK